MRNTLSDMALNPSVVFGAAAEPAKGQRPRALDSAARVLTVFVLAMMPLAIFSIVKGQLVPALVAVPGLAAVMGVRALIRADRFKIAGRGLIATVLTLGAGLSLAEPQVVDFGLATALLAPVLAALLGDRTVERLAWLGTGVVLVVSVVLGAPLFDALRAQQVQLFWTGGIAYAAASLLVILVAHGLNKTVRDAEEAKVAALRQLIEQLQSAVIRISGQGKTLFISNSAENLFGCKRYELSGNGIVERMHVQDRPLYLTALSAAQRGGKPRTVDVRMRRDEEGEAGRSVPNFIWIEVNISPVRDHEPESGAHECLLLFRDIEQRKRQEQEMRDARKAAQDASEAKSHFLATIGHELRTPLNAIVGFSDMMNADVSGTLDANQREYVQLIHKSGLHLLDIVNMLLDMSRIEAGKFELQLEAFRIESLIGPCVHMVEPMAAERGVAVKFETPDELPMVVGDERAYRQILINLLSNAVKFSHAGGTVRLTFRRKGAFVQMSVADDGIGMPSEIVQRIGEPFFQAHSGAARRYEGTGLGLSIVRGLIDLHQGSLEVHSREGNGTTMSVSMPLKGPQVQAKPGPVVETLRPTAAQIIREPDTTMQPKSAAQ